MAESYLEQKCESFSCANTSVHTYTQLVALAKTDENIHKHKLAMSNTLEHTLLNNSLLLIRVRQFPSHQYAQCMGQM